MSTSTTARASETAQHWTNEGQRILLNGKCVAVSYDKPDDIARGMNSRDELLAALKDAEGYLSAIENMANQIEERAAIQSKLATIRAAIAKAEDSA